jgi:hypothetical protein
MPCFRCKNMRFLSVIQVTLAPLGHIETNPSTEGFTETFTEGFSVHPSVLFWIQFSSGIIAVMAGFGLSMSTGPQVAISFTSLGRRLSFRTYSAKCNRLWSGCAL